MSVISMKQLLEAGVHFGHQTRRWNPKMAEYIFTERNGIYIIDLQKTVKKIDEAYYFVRDMVMEGGSVLFVGTKKQAQDAIREEALRCGMYFVNNRWLGGMLTNFKTIRRGIDRMKEIKKMEAEGTFEVLPKKEVSKLRLEMEKLEKNLGGIAEMKKQPFVLFIVDPKKEHNAILEARKLGIPIVAIVDTNCDPDEVDFVIPGNDDAIRAVKLISGKIADAVIEARQGEMGSAGQETVTETVVVDDPDSKPEMIEVAKVAAPAKAAEVAEPVKAAEVAAPVKAVEVAEPVKAAEAVETVKATDVAETAEVAEVAEAAEVAETVKVVETAEVAAAPEA